MPLPLSTNIETPVLQELSAVGGTDDVTYGCSADQALSDANKLANADNFNVSALLSPSNPQI